MQLFVVPLKIYEDPPPACRVTTSNSLHVVTSVCFRCLIVTLIGSHLFQPLRIGRANEVGLHVVDAPLRIHQVLVVLALDLDHAHHHTVDHVD